MLFGPAVGPIGRARSARAASPGVYPLLNVTHDGDHIYVRAEMPGVDPAGLEISATRDTLSLAGERRIATEGEGTRYHRRERQAGRFRRAIALPVEIDPGRVDARCVNGILTVTLPRAEDTKPRQIRVRSGEEEGR